MAEITIASLTDKTEGTVGTGVFDILMNSTNLHLNEQYNEGRITGAEFATVYLGAMQAVMAQAVAFTLGKQEADKRAELIDAQVTEVNEKIDLVIAQTAAAYEAIKASQDKTLRDNLLNNSQIEKISEEIDLLQSQDLEVLASTVRGDKEIEAKVADLNHDIAIKAQQEYEMEEKNGETVTTYTFYTDGVSGATTTATNLGAVKGPVLGTSISAGPVDSLVDLEKAVQVAKELLIKAQTLGFASDTKQKLFKAMLDGYAVNLSIAGVGNVPEANQDAAIDQLAQEMLDDLGSTVVIQSVTQVPDTGGTVPGDPAVDP